MNKKILLIEDDNAIIRLIRVSLETNGYEVICAKTGIEGISIFLSSHPDLVLLDMGLPDIDGEEVLSQIRQISNAPIIIVSAREQEREKVYALDNGANDYVTKPFSIKELLARIRVAFRSSIIVEKPNKTFTLDNLFVDFDKHQVMLDNKEIHLTPIEFKLLQLLIENKGKVLTHSFIQKMIWGYEADDEYQSLRTFMATLRRKIEYDTNQPRFIITEIGIGYRFVDE